MCSSELLLFSSQPLLPHKTSQRTNIITAGRSYVLFTIPEGVLVLLFAGKRRGGHEDTIVDDR